MKINKKTLFLFCLVPIMSCNLFSNKNDTINVEYINENKQSSNSFIENDSKEFTSQKEFDNVKFSLAKITPKQRASLLFQMGTEEFKVELKEQEKLLVYKLRISSMQDISILNFTHPNFQTREEKLMYFMNEFPKQVRLKLNSQEILPVMSHLENPNNMVNYIDILLSFENSIEFKDPILIIEDNFFKKGRIKLKA